MKKTVVIQKWLCTASVSFIAAIKIQASPVHSPKKEEESYRRVIYGFFERIPAASGSKGKRFPG